MSPRKGSEPIFLHQLLCRFQQKYAGLGHIYVHTHVILFHCVPEFIITL